MYQNLSNPTTDFGNQISHAGSRQNSSSTLNFDNSNHSTMDSPSVSKKRKVAGMSGAAQEEKNLKSGPCFLKLLIPDVIAGALIGKGGVTLQNLQATTGSVIRLSAGGVYFPGTNERLVVASGSQEAINLIMYEVMVRVRDSISNNNMNGEFDEVNMCLKMVLPNSAISIVIGKGGESVRALIAKTGAKITASQRQENMQERIVTMAGNFDQVREAADNIIFRVQTDHENLRNMIQNGLTATSVSSMQMMNQGGMGGGMGGGMNNMGGGMGGGMNNMGGGMGGGMNNMGGGMGGGMHPSPMSKANMAAMGFTSPYGIDRSVAIQQVTVEFLVLNSLIGGVIGKGGSLLKDISQRAGAKIKIADKNDSEDDSRRFFVSGPLDSVHLAHSLIVQRVMQVDQQNQMNAMQQGQQSHGALKAPSLSPEPQNVPGMGMSLAGMGLPSLNEL